MPVGSHIKTTASIWKKQLTKKIAFAIAIFVDGISSINFLNFLEYQRLFIYLLFRFSDNHSFYI